MDRPVYGSSRRYSLASNHHYDTFRTRKSVVVDVLDATGAFGNTIPVRDQPVRTVPSSMLLQLYPDGSGSLVSSPSFARLEVIHGFRFELERIFSYKSHGFIWNKYTALWVVSYTECDVSV